MSKQINIKNEITNGIISIVSKTKNNSWQGTMTDLNRSLSKYLGKKISRELPGSPSALRVAVNRIINRLRKQSVSTKFTRSSDHMRTRYVSFTSR
jgi:hypothetical protein